MQNDKTLTERFIEATTGADKSLRLLACVLVEMPSARAEMLALIDDPQTSPELATLLKVLMAMGNYALSGQLLQDELLAVDLAQAAAGHLPN